MITLEQVEYIITELALKHNLVNSAFAGPSIYSLNADEIKEYPFIYVSPTGTHTLKENTTRFTFTIFAVDRLFEDSSNEDNIGSVSVETIRNLHLQLKKLEFITDIQDEIDVRLFTETEKMSDRCAGAYATIWLEVLNSTTCGSFFDEFDDYLGDYFNDYEIHNVLDALASKEYVNRMVAAASISGMTPEEFERIMGNYVLENKFATINGEKITNRERFSLVDQSAYTQDIQNIYEAISGATPADYLTMQEQVSANTESIANLQSAVTNIDDYCFFVSGYIKPWDARNSDALVDYVLSLGDDFPKARVFIPIGRNPIQWIQYRVYKVSGNTIYVSAIYNNGSSVAKISYGTYTKGVAPNSGDFSEFELSNNINNYIQTLRTDVSALKSSKQNKLSAGRGITIDSDTNVISADVASSTIHYLVEITQSAYDALTTKDPNTLYIIKG